MESLFETLTTAVGGAYPVALAAAFAWGVLSILLSPCHLASIPLIIGFIQEQDRPTQRRALALSSLFALGMLVTIALIGAVTAAAGRLMGDVGTGGNVLVAVIFFVVGLSFLDIIPLKLPAPSRGESQAPGRLGGLHPGVGFRNRAGSLHLRLHGSDAGRHLQGCRNQRCVWDGTACRLRPGSLPRDRDGRRRFSLGPADPRLEFGIPGRDTHQENLRRVDYSGRILPAIYRLLEPFSGRLDFPLLKSVQL